MFLVVLNKHPSIKKDTLGLIKKTLWIKNLIKLLWLDLNFVTNFYKIKNMKKTDLPIAGNTTIALSYYVKRKKSILKT